jgi:cell division ATPase FtsA
VSVWQRRLRGQPEVQDRPTYVAVVEPGTTTLRLLVLETLGGQATIWGWAEVPCPPGQVDDPSWLSNACTKALSRAEEMAQDLAQQWILPDRILVGLPTSRLLGRAWPIEQRRSRPERPVEERELEALLSRGLRLAANRLESMAEDGSAWLLVDSTAVTLTIDTQGVTDPVGFRAQEMGASVFAALAQRRDVLIWREVAQELEFSELVLAAAPVALAATVSEPQAILIDMGGTSTDLIWCRLGRPTALASVLVGGSTMTHLLVRKWNLAPDRAERLKQIYAAGQLDAEASGQVQEVMLPGLQFWLQETERALSQLNRDEPLPQRLYLLGGASALAEVGESVQALAWSRRLSFSRYPQIRALRTTDVPGVSNRTEHGRGRGDVPALALAAWAARLQQPADRPARILADLCHG